MRVPVVPLQPWKGVFVVRHVTRRRVPWNGHDYISLVVLLVVTGYVLLIAVLFVRSIGG